jgi:predicted acyl esterase
MKGKQSFSSLSFPLRAGWMLVAAFISAMTSALVGMEHIRLSEIYPESVRTSQDVTVRDGTRLTIDIYRPAENGVAVDKRFPVVIVATPLTSIQREK